MRKLSPLLVIFLVVFFDLVAFGIVIPILPFYAKNFGADAYTWSWVMAIFSIAQFLFAPLWGALSDRIGRRPVLLATIFLSALSTCVIALGNSVQWIFIGRLLAGIFAANISTATAYIADSTDEANRAKGMGIIGAGFGLGFIFGPAIGALLSPWSLTAPLWIAAILGFANFVLAWFILPEPLKNLEARRKNRRRFSFDVLRKAFADQAISAPIVLFFLSTLAFTQLEVSFGFYVAEKFDYTAREAGYLLTLMGLVMVAIQGRAIGPLAKRFTEARLAPFGMLCMCIALIGAAYSATVLCFAIFLGLIALGHALVHPSLSSLVSRAAPKEITGGIMGIFQSSSALGRIIGPPLAGYLYVNYGLNFPLWTAAAVLALGFLITLTFFKLAKN